MNGLEFVAYVAPQPMACPVCGLANDLFTGIARQRSTVTHAPLVGETIPARILGWALQCGCLLSVADWEWIAAAGIPPRWIPKAAHQAVQGIQIGDGGTQNNTFH